MRGRLCSFLQNSGASFISRLPHRQKLRGLGLKRADLRVPKGFANPDAQPRCEEDRSYLRPEALVKGGLFKPLSLPF